MKYDSAFRKIVWAYYKKHGRHDLPWRKTHDAYKILVSEVMLQQTQVDRVQPYYRAFLQKFPTARRLAGAPLSEVLKSWQGLGYNRRAKMLHTAAKEIVLYGMPKTAEALEMLPGVGPYTARAVAAFAYEEDGLLVETNIRTAVMHHFFPKRKNISDAEIENVLKSCMPKGRAREWNYALMDYGASLKRAGMKLNVKSVRYTKQSRFAGSLREARGVILRELTKGTATKQRLLGLCGDNRVLQVQRALEALTKEKLIRKIRARYALSD